MKNIYGTMRIPSENLSSFLEEIFKAGYNWIDTAWIYGHGENEKALGSALDDLGEKVNFKIQTKIWIKDYENVEEAFDNQLKSLKKESVDSLLLHRPTRDFNKTILAWKALISLKEKGLAKSIGVSNFDKDMIDILVKETKVKPEVNQFEFSILNGRFDRIKYAIDNEIEAQGYSPLTGWYDEVKESPVLVSTAQKYNATASQIMLNYNRAFGTFPVIGTTNLDRAKENLKLIELKMEDIQLLGTVNQWKNKFSETIE